MDIRCFWPAFLLASASLASASPIYQEIFSGGLSLTSDPLVNSSAISSYFLTQGSNTGNGYVTTNSNNDPQTGGLDPGVTAQPSGVSSSYFLVNATGTTNSSGSNVFFASSNITVTQNTNYTFSFELTNVNSPSPATITMEMNGVSLLSGVSALGYYGDGTSGHNWQTFSVTWNSGSNTTANLSLLDTNTATYGNDFAVDNIQLYATPEPSTLSLFAAPLAWLLIRQRRKAAAKYLVEGPAF